MHPETLSTPMEAGSSASRARLGTRIGQYEIIRLLGRGGMGEVYLARDLRLGRLVAVKLLTSQEPNLDAWFLAEARATARCRHENIVVIYEVGEHGGQPYMVLEYLEGQTLRQWLSDRAAAGLGAGVPPARAVELMLPVVRALACAHDQGIVHRDLKPENVMLTRTGVIKVLDFGVAKRMAVPLFDREAPGDMPRSAGGSARVGTLPYMSPEQMSRGAVDHRTDLWSAGIMLFELVAGTRPRPDSAAPGATTPTEPSPAMPSASQRMPELGVLAGVIDRCLLTNPADRTASAQLLLAELEALAPDRRPVPTAVSAPFTGLAAFQEADASRFFGRDREVDLVVAELRGRPLVAIVGASGAGKSSLVRAGVLPALKRSGEGWHAHIVRPGHAPLAALAAVLLHDSRASGDRAVDDGAAALDAIIERLRVEVGYLGAQLRARAASQQRRVVLFVDQLEELYTLGVSPDQCAAFLACLAAMADDVSSPLRVLVVMRWDFLDRLIDGHRLATEVTRGLVVLRAMNRDGMREALLRPVEASEYRFESPALVDRMIDDLAATPGALPLLQFTAARLWEARDRERRLLTEASYEQLGGVAGALARHADAVLSGMSQTQQGVARTVLERLVTPERTRTPVRVDELRALHRDPGLVDGIVQHLTEMRLVVIERGVHGADRTAELGHDSLIDRWPTLVRWLDDNQDDAAMLARLRAAARDWERSGHASGLLWTGEVASEARAWHRQYRGELAAVEQRYLSAVLAAADRARRVRRRVFGAILSTVAIAAIAMGWLAWKQSREARRARDATRMAAMQTLPDDPTTQLALLREIEDIEAPPPGALQEAKRLLHADVARMVITEPDPVMSAAFSPDGRRIASASGNEVRLWSADGMGEPQVLRGHEGTVWSAAFSPDGQRVVSSDNTTVRVWNADGRGEATVVNDRRLAVEQAAFSPDGQRIVAVTNAGAQIWNRDGSGEPITPRGQDGLARSAEWSPDGQRLVLAMRDNTVRLWSGDGSRALAILYGHDAPVARAAFSPDGQRIVSASHDKTVRIWNADGGGEPVVLRGHAEVVLSAAFSPDGQHAASGSRDKTVRVWRSDGRGTPRVLRGHDDTVYSVVYSPDGQRIVSASLDRTVRTWDATASREPLVLHGHQAPVNTVAFSPDGRRVASASNDKTVQVWSADGTGEPVVLRGHDDAVYSVAFSPDGRRIVSGSMDGTVRVWSVEGLAAPLVLRGHDGVVAAATFSPDGRRIASASADDTVRVWNADGRGEPLILRGHDSVVYSVAFSPDGRRIASASDDKTVRVWSADGRGAPLVLRGHGETVYSAMFSPDGHRIVSASDDKTVRVWDADGGGEPVVLRGHEDWVYWAEFSPDGSRIVSASKDKTLRIWRADGTGEPVILMGEGSLAHQARFSPDGRRIVSASDDHAVRIWQDLAPAPLDDPRLWTATSYCMPVERRIKLLGVSEDQAVRDRRRCRERVEHAREPP